MMNTMMMMMRKALLRAEFSADSSMTQCGLSAADGWL